MMQSNLSDKNLLILANGYPDNNNMIVDCPFVKNQVNALRLYFKHIYVIVPIPIFSVNYHNSLQYWKYAQNYSYDNVTIFYIHYPFFDELRHFSYFRDIVYKSIEHAVERAITKYNLEYDLMHVHFTQPLGFIAARLKRKYNIPYILTMHEQAFSLSKELCSNRKDIFSSWENADALIRVNKFDLDILKKYNINCYYVPNGYPAAFNPPSRNQCRELLHLDSAQMIIFSLGSLYGTRKGYPDLIQAISLLKDDYPNMHSYIAGYGPPESISQLNKLIRNYLVEDRVHILGKIPSEQIPLWFGACNISVLASHAEGNPTVMFEALGCGRPYVGTAVGGVEDIITDPKYGILCEPNNVPDLADCIRKGLTTEWDWKSIKEYGEEFSWENIANKQLLPIYLSVINK